MIWIFKAFVEGAICEPMITLTLMTSAIFGSYKLFMTENKSERSFNHVGAW